MARLRQRRTKAPRAGARRRDRQERCSVLCRSARLFDSRPARGGEKELYFRRGRGRRESSVCARGTLRSLTQRAQTLNHRRQCCPNTLYLDIGCCCVRAPVHAHTHRVRDGTGLSRFHARFGRGNSHQRTNMWEILGVAAPGLRKGALASSQLLPLAMREAPRVDAVRPQRAKARTVVSCPVVPTRLGATAPAPRPLQGRPRPAAVGQ